MPNSDGGPIFISYSRRDDRVMRSTAAFLRGKGITAWVDNEKLIPGTPIWEAEIEKAIKAASAVVVIMSPDSKDSEWVRREISLADQYRKRIFPILVRGDEDSSITLRLITRQFVDLRRNEKAGLDSLHQAISQYLDDVNSQHQVAVPENATPSQAATSEAGLAGALPAWLAVGWAASGLFAGYLWSEFSGEGGWLIAGVLGGGAGGLITALLLRTGNVVSHQVSTFRGMLAWAGGMSIAWLLGWEISDGSVAAGLGMALAAMIGLAGMLGFEYLRNQWQEAAVIVLTWFIGGVTIWIIARTILIDALAMNDQGAAWAIGTAASWAIAGFVLGRQLLKTHR